ncbi:hypothetical protein ACFL6S_28345 [Candidatus Poribacteria bacterium]
MDEALTESLRKIATGCGADLFGIATASDFFSYEGKRSPFFYVDNAKSVIVIGHSMNDPILDVWLNSIDGKRHYYFINEILGGIALAAISALLEAGKRAILSPYSGVYAKDAAALAGIGIIGKNNLLITGQFGPRVRLRTIITDAELQKNPQKLKSPCDDCPRFCWSACPAQAFATGRFSREACIEYDGGHAEKPSENSNLHCRECELACPLGK